MSSHLTPEQIAGFQEIFDLVDTDKGGSISPEELHDLIRLVGMSITEDELDAMVEEIDEDGNGEIDFDEFLAVMSRSTSTTYTAEDVRKAFKTFEHNTPPGFVAVDDLKRALRDYGTEVLDSDDIDALVDSIQPDFDHPHLINYMYYVRQMDNE